MKLNKLIPLLLFLLLALPFAAQAERVVNPVYPVEKQTLSADTLRRMDEARLRGDGLSAAADYPVATLEKVQGDYLSPTTWRMILENPSPEYNYLYTFQLSRLDDHFSDGLDNVVSQNESASNEFVFSLVASGSYELRAWVDDGVHYGMGYDSYSFEVDDPDHPSVESRVKSLVAECKAAGNTTDFDKAVWLHDWITTHMYYDYTRTHRGVDGALIRGMGVCDSYAKCYYLLLEAAGVEGMYVSGLGNGGNHAWNAVKFDGDWYWVDVTWDDSDPKKSSVAHSGYESHLYFCLPDELMSVDHTRQDTDAPAITCNSYDYNYYIHTGKASLWTPEFTNYIEDMIDEGLYCTNVEVPEFYQTENPEVLFYNSNEVLPWAIAAEAVRRMDWDVSGQTVKMNVDYTPTVVHTEIDFTGRELKLPAELTDVEEAAFEDDAGFMSVTLSDNAQTVGPGAFAGSTTLWRVIVPNAGTAIDDTAFGSNSHLTFVGPAGGSAESYASAHGCHFLEQ